MTATIIPFAPDFDREAIERRAAVEGSVVVGSARALIINNPAAYVEAGELRKEVNVKDAALETAFKVQKQAIDAAKKTVLEFEKRVREPFQLAREIIDDKLLVYSREQERLRREEEEKLRKLAEKLDEERRLSEAEALVAAGVPEEAALSVLDQPSTMPAPSIPSAVPKVAGLSMRETWRAEVVDAVALVQFAAMHPEMMPSLVLPNGPGLNALARSQKGALSIPGVRAVREEAVSGSRR